jgi:thiol:disulfide interchange protein DsbC
LIDLRNGSNLSKLNELMETKRLVQTFPPKDMLIYPAKDKVKAELTIFTDTSCSYCRKMHREIPQLQSQGVTVRLIPYPRRGLDGYGYEELKSVWCSDHPDEAFSSVVEDRVMPDSLDDCDKAEAVNAGYRLGNRIGISGTPLLVLGNGEKIKGYKPAAELIRRMHISTGEGVSARPLDR